MPARRLLRTSLTVFATAAALCATAPAALATLPGDNGRLALRSADPGGDYLTTIGPNGGDGRYLGDGYGPSWSPTGSRLAFGRGAEVDCSTFTTWRSQVLIGDSLGRSPQPLGIADSSNPTFSPDGSRIAFERSASFDPQTCEGQPSSLWVANTDGAEAREIVPASESPSDPEWSPDGGSLVFSSYREQDRGLFIVNPDGTDIRRLVSGDASAASWSPDGRKLVFQGEDDLMVVNADGTGLTRLSKTAAAVRELEPVWAPDGRSVAYTVFTDYEQSDVYMTDLNGQVHVSAFAATCALVDSCIGEGYVTAGWQPLPPGSNLVPNPSFEDNLRGWGSYAGTLTRVAQSGAPDGAYVAKATRASGATKFSISDGQGGFRETIPFTSAGETYVGSVQVKAASSSSVGKPVTVYLREKSASGTVRESKVASTLGSSWKRIAVSAKVSGTGNSLGLRVEQSSAVAGNAFYGDAMSLTKARQQVGPATAGTLLTTMVGDSKRVSKVSIGTGFDAVRLRAYLDGMGGTSRLQSVRAVIYADSSGAPGARVRSTGSVTIAAGRAAGWVDFELSAPVSLKAGSYWVGLHSSTPSAVARWAGTGNEGALRFNSDSYSDGAASSFGTARTDAKELSLQVVGG